MDTKSPRDKHKSRNSLLEDPDTSVRKTENTIDAESEKTSLEEREEPILHYEIAALVKELVKVRPLKTTAFATVVLSSTASTRSGASSLEANN